LEFTVYCDGGCSGNKRGAGCPGGYGYIILDPSNTIIKKDGGFEYNTTNNRMELQAAIKGMSALREILNEQYDDATKHSCIVKTDSKYVCDNFNDYLPIWKKNGWRKSKRWFKCLIKIYGKRLINSPPGLESIIFFGFVGTQKIGGIYLPIQSFKTI